MMQGSKIVLVSLLSLATSGVWAQFNKCIGPDGSVSYQQLPCPGTEQTVQETIIGTLRREGFIEPEMVVIAPGTFWMGSSPNETGHEPREQLHPVTVEGFALGKYEVTVNEYAMFAQATGRGNVSDEDRQTRGNYPVGGITWWDAIAYTRWLSAKTGESYRLPTEAEWEYAARAGTRTPYWWGDDVGRNRASCVGCNSQWGDNTLAPVGSFAANPYGLYDTHGNVSEWTCSRFDYDRNGEIIYNGSEQICADVNQMGGVGRNSQVPLRGGSMTHRPGSIRAASREAGDVGANPDIQPHWGFRLAKSLGDD